MISLNLPDPLDRRNKWTHSPSLAREGFGESRKDGVWFVASSGWRVVSGLWWNPPESPFGKGGKHRSLERGLLDRVGWGTLQLARWSRICHVGRNKGGLR